MGRYPRVMNSWLFSGLLFGVIMLASSTALLAQKQITGVRTWELADGTKQRASLWITKVGKMSFTGEDEKMRVVKEEQFSEKHREIVREVKAGNLKIADRVGKIQSLVSVPTNDPKWVEDLDFSRMCGEKRKWLRKDGKSVEGELVNITDDEIHLLIKGEVWKVSVEDLSEDDRAYLDRAVAGEVNAQVKKVDFPEREFFVYGEEKIANRWISGERFMDDLKPRITMEQAAQIACNRLLEHVKRDEWRIKEVQEFPIVPRPFTFLSDGKVGRGPCRSCFIVRFDLAETAVKKLQKVFPYSRGRTSWELAIHLFDDGAASEFSTR